MRRAHDGARIAVQRLTLLIVARHRSPRPFDLSSALFAIDTPLYGCASRPRWDTAFWRRQGFCDHLNEAFARRFPVKPLGAVCSRIDNNITVNGDAGGPDSLESGLDRGWKRGIGNIPSQLNGAGHLVHILSPRARCPDKFLTDLPGGHADDLVYVKFTLETVIHIYLPIQFKFSADLLC